MMNTPRCGLSDVDPDNPDNDPNSDSLESLAARRRKRYVLTGNKWERNDLKWRLNDGTSDLERTHVTNIMNNALQYWEDASALDITEGTGSDAEIQVSFEDGAHGDNAPFDGPGGTLAHAYYPTSPPVSIAGDAHFDDGETFTDGSSSGINLLQVATHEFGHSLGLDHSDVRGAVMFPFYLGYNATFALDRDDIAGIQAIYGVNTNDPEQPDGSGADCFPITITWATSTQDGRHYLCNATYCYRMSSNTIDAGYPKRIQEDFPGLPDGPDASFYYPTSGKTYVFKGSEVWRMSNQSIDSGYPKSIESEFPGIPSDLSAAYIWHTNNKIYFVKDTEYYRVSTPGGGVDLDIDNPYPRLFSAWWRGLPSTIDAAFQWHWSDAETYMFAGSQYYRLHPFRSEVLISVPPYPRETAVYWFDCDPTDGISDGGFNAGIRAVELPSVVAVMIVMFLNTLWVLN
ncbi:stromelysin-3-like [Lytechinus variegatus]|uniref:stromelysin-3-like n=1 Tax=Lytechinus variegatus TaxID=7654 RepID=UPI001BB0FB73|nr:stromelysin-3-like [Lytechinus variegatus]